MEFIRGSLGFRFQQKPPYVPCRERAFKNTFSFFAVGPMTCPPPLVTAKFRQKAGIT
jgi:hypothetical protein